MEIAGGKYSEKYPDDTGNRRTDKSGSAGNNDPHIVKVSTFLKLVMT
jgi:hypothetical protein